MIPSLNSPDARDMPLSLSTALCFISVIDGGVASNGLLCPFFIAVGNPTITDNIDNVDVN